MPQIQKQPAGLLSFLSVFSGGKAPRELSDIVQPTIDMNEFYASDSFETVSTTVAVAAAGINTRADVTVPSGERWRLHNLTGTASGWSAVLGAGMRINLTVLMRGEGGRVSLMENLSNLTAINNVAEAQRIGAPLRTPVLLPPGTVLSAIVATDNGAVTFTLSASALIERIGA